MKLKKTSHKIIIAAIIAVMATMLVFIFFWLQAEPQIQGQLVFDKTFDKGPAINRIVIDNINGTIELNQEDGYWKVGNYGNYYADFDAIKKFIDELNNSIYVMEVPPSQNQNDNVVLNNPLEQKDFSGTLIRTYVDSKQQDGVIIGVRASDKNYFFARLENKDNAWLINWNYDIPVVARDWLPHSIIEIPQASIQSVSIDNKELTRQVSSQGFTDRFGSLIDIDWLLQNLTSFEIDDIMYQDNFDKKYPAVDIKKIYDITTFYGLVFEMIFYDTGDNKAWVNIKLLADTLPKAAVYDYIKDNGFLYDGWYFSISPRQKDFLLNYNLF